jgi:phage terminase Nu1 subunit (DNA packaging protein)
MTIADYARRRGCARNSVLRAIDQGRLRESVGVNGRGHRLILDPDLADEEWSRSAQYRRPNDNPATPIKAANKLVDLREAREAEALRRDRIKTAQAELDLAQQRGELVRVADVRAEVTDAFATVRTRLLAVPSRCAQQIPHLTARDVAMLDDLIREALEALADGDDR